MQHYILMLLGNAFMYVIILQFLRGMLGKRENVSNGILTLTGVVWVFGTFLVCECFHVPVLNFFVSFTLTFGISFLYNGNVGKRILSSLMIIVFSSASDMAVYMIAKNRFSAENVYEGSFVFTVVVFGILEAVVIAVLKQDRSVFVGYSETIVLFAVSICLLVILYFVTEGEMNENARTMTSIFILLCCFLMFYTYHIVIKNLDEKYSNRLLQESVLSYRKELEWIKKSELKVEGMRHDLKNHLIELKAMSEKNDYIGLVEYIDSMYKDLPSAKKYSKCGMYEIDSLINYLLEEEGEKLRNVSVNVLIPCDIEIDKYKLNIILGNLLQNAIDASLNSEKKELSLEIKYIKGLLHIFIRNSFSNRIETQDGEIQSTKRGEGKHGIGLKNVKRLVKEQNGEMEINVDEDIFSVKVLVYL